jgi:DNA-binding beta-propeller fold protein YncE
VVQVFDLNSRKFAQWGPAPGKKFSWPVGVAYNPAGRLYVSDSETGLIHVLDQNGQPLAAIGAGELGRPCGLAFDVPRQRLFVADSARHQVVVFSPQGKLLQRIGDRGTDLGQFNFPTNVALDGQGRLYVSDSLNFRVQQFSPDLQPLRATGSKGDMPGFFSQPKGVGVDSQDHLYVMDSQFEVAQVFDDQGVLLMDFGQEGDGAGEFWLPAGIFIDAHNRIWVADSYNHRVQVFDYLPEQRP